jgi:hypothetical protein
MQAIAAGAPAAFPANRRSMILSAAISLLAFYKDIRVTLLIYALIFEMCNPSRSRRLRLRDREGNCEENRRGAILTTLNPAAFKGAR